MYNHFLKPYHPLLLAGLTLGMITTLSACEQHPVDKPATATAKPAQAGLRVFIDPATGKFVSEPPAGSVSEPQNTQDTQANLSTGTELVKTVAADGSVTIMVGDRFKIPLVATVDCKGEVTSTHKQKDKQVAAEACKHEKEAGK